MKKETKKKPLERHKNVLKKISENIGSGMNVQQAVIDAGYSESYAKSGHIKETKSWEILIEERLSDDTLTRVHTELLNSHRPDHMVFPPLLMIKNKKGGDNVTPKEEITDEMIIEFLASTGCKVKRIVHGDQARHVYFWSPDNMARDKALDKGYKLKSKYAPEEYNLKFKSFSKRQLIEAIMGKITKKK